MAKPAKKNNNQGHPAKKDPLIAKMNRLQTDLVYITQEVHRRLKDPIEISHWNASVFGVMNTYSRLTGLPSPDSTVDLDFDEFMAERAARMARLEAWEESQRKIELQVDEVKVTPKGIEVMGKIPEGADLLKAVASPPVSIRSKSIISETVAREAVDKVSKGFTTVKTCKRCSHMSFNHAWTGEGHGSCSFTNCICNEFVH